MPKSGISKYELRVSSNMLLLILATYSASLAFYIDTCRSLVSSCKKNIGIHEASKSFFWSSIFLVCLQWGWEEDNQVIGIILPQLT